MQEYVFGANILENLTTGMYQDSKIIYREYIQNACDQIDKAYEIGLLSPNSGTIRIWLDQEKRIITIEDNATGISSKNFKHTLADIANSDKKIGTDKGFRGIGRLCGLAYCKELVFSTTAAGEDTISIMRCHAQKMRELINSNKKYTANEVLDQIYHFDKKKTTDIKNHWFKVELIGINEENKELLDSNQVNNYLSFVAPVPYQNSFYYSTEIYNYAKKLNHKIDEYNISLNGEQIFKKYNLNFKTSKGDDSIFNLSFKEIFDSNHNLLAWLWIGISHFKGIVAKECRMRGLRLRKENIQIGNEDALQKLFKEDRGHHYFIGEVFAVSPDLIPNSQRDYFNENPVRLEFEKELRKYFNTELKSIYYECSAINSAFNKIDAYEKKKFEFEQKMIQGKFVNTEHQKNAYKEIEKSKELAIKAQKEIQKKKIKANKAPNNIVSQIISRTESDREKQNHNINVYDAHLSSKITLINRRVDKLSSYSNKERKLISKIFDIIVKVTDKETSEMILQKIEDGLK